MTEGRRTCPFEIGDLVRFVPNAHAFGWAWSSFDRVKHQPGDTGIITLIKDEMYLFLYDDRVGFHWECFERA
jgi:hypothetical protein